MNELASSAIGIEDWGKAGVSGTGELGSFARTQRRGRAPSVPAVLARTVELEIVPRLLLAHRQSLAVRRAAADAAQTHESHDAEVAEITGLILSHDFAAARHYAEDILSRGVSMETLSLDVLAPSARLMGTMWEGDTCDFTAVSVGVWRLQQLMRELSGSFHRVPESPALERRALLTPVPGEQHSFGVAMVAEFFRNAGWHVMSGPIATQQDLARTVRSRWFAVVVLSLSVIARLEALATAIRAVRRASKNPMVGVMVGGALFNEKPELVRLVGADATSSDARLAPVQAASLVTLLAERD